MWMVEGSYNMRIYLDVCCLNRPFDDQIQERIRLESEAVMAILSKVSTGEWVLISSEFLDFEIGKIPDPERRNNVRYLSTMAQIKVSNNESIEARQAILEKMGFQPLDAFHIASAEKAQVEILLTTDDEMLKIYYPHQKNIRIKIENPVQFLMEVTTT